MGLACLSFGLLLPWCGSRCAMLGKELPIGETTKKQQYLSTSPNDPDQESTETTPPLPQVHQQPPRIVISGSASFIPHPSYISSNGTRVSLEQQQFEALNQKRPRYTTCQWKLLPYTSQHKHSQVNILSTESSPYPSALANPPPHQTKPQNTAASSLDTTSSPSHSPRWFYYAASGQETSKLEDEQIFRQQFINGKYVSPVWKPNEMLWLACWIFHLMVG
ncbi:uncharacterized protein Fot_55760 [Forsythia ovata]|uniref:Uncharacterized protein n=1 Tax=Forsythia ovata TaxID=205694 RepID=A0ABD1P326_9LAMI